MERLAFTLARGGGEVEQPRRFVSTGEMNLLAVLVRNVGEVTVLPVVDHHVQTLRVAVGS